MRLAEKIVVFPMHVAEKAQREGARTRDWHLIEALASSDDVGEIVIADRPITVAELALGRRQLHLEGIAPSVTRLRLHSSAVIAPMTRRQRWWTAAYDPSTLTRPSRERLTRELQSADAVISFVPTAEPAWRGAAERTLLDILDNWLIHPQLGERDPRAFRAAYERSLSSAASITANSEATAELARTFGRDAVVLPNGVDWDRFRDRSTIDHDSWAGRLRGVKRPWIVYAGKLQQRFDRELALGLLERSGGSLILAGQVLDRRWMKPVLSHHRCHWFGDVPYSSLAGLIGCADVAVIPHRVGEGEVGGDPIKVYEYASIGVRIVSTRITGWRRFQRFANIAGGKDEFIEAVVRLGCDDRGLSDRLASARRPSGVTWEARAQVLLAQLPVSLVQRNQPSVSRGAV